MSRDAPMDVTFLGAAREVTGSCHLVRVGEAAVALDFGLFQGHRAEANASNLAVPFEPGRVNAVILSHAHIDHSGRLPLLARLGFNVPIYATPATRDLCAIMLSDSAHIQQKDAEFLARRQRSYVAPLYDQRDVERLMRKMIAVPIDTPFDVAPGMRATFAEAGHILGSASVVLECTSGGALRRLVYSGDIGRSGLPIIRDPRPPAGADVVIMESTYGDRDHPPIAGMPDALGAVIRDTAARGGRVLIPAFAVGRSQEILYDLHRLRRAGAIPRIPIVLDSPLAIAATSVFAAHPEAMDRSEDLVAAVHDLFAVEGLELARDTADSKALNERRGPMIVIAASGMAEAGRILHHLANGAPDPRNTILIVGFQAEHTLGRRIVERRPMLKIFGEEVPLRARVEVLEGYSAHADRGELRRWAHAVADARTARVFLVHGEAPAQDAFANVLRADGFDVSIPRRGTRAAF
ncbi:MAG TPA: MBL fold metallo-hydrolase [Gemmatimonadaceae bacterium]|nr:MBL fold metallo-hydrolase [Gemmatimonadaceae bacterium]